MSWRTDRVQVGLTSKLPLRYSLPTAFGHTLRKKPREALDVRAQVI
jgi:hypothetical protein